MASKDFAHTKYSTIHKKCMTYQYTTEAMASSGGELRTYSSSEQMYVDTLHGLYNEISLKQLENFKTCSTVSR